MLDSVYLDILTVYNREYQKYSIDRRIYFGPIDDVRYFESGVSRHLLTSLMVQDEAERLEIQHRVFNMLFDYRLIFPPISKPRRVLDCGYGSGSWAVEVAEQYPDCQVRADCG